MGEKRNAHKTLVGKITEKPPVKIRRNIRRDKVKYDKNSNMLAYDAVQIGKKLQKTWIFVNAVLRTSDLATKMTLDKQAVRMEMDGTEPRTLTVATFNMRCVTASCSTTSELVYFFVCHEYMLHYNYHVASYSHTVYDIGTSVLEFKQQTRTDYILCIWLSLLARVTFRILMTFAFFLTIR